MFYQFCQILKEVVLDILITSINEALYHYLVKQKLKRISQKYKIDANLLHGISLQIPQKVEFDQ